MIYLVRANSLIISNDWISSFEVIEPFCENPFVSEINSKLKGYYRKKDIFYPLFDNNGIESLRINGYAILFCFTIENIHFLFDSEHDDMKPFIRDWKLKELENINI
jgi:hypothetical protein